MKSKVVSLILVFTGSCLIVVSLVLLVLSAIREDIALSRYGIALAALATIPFFVNVLVFIREYECTRPSKSGQINYRYYSLKRKTKKDLQLFLMYDDAETAFGIKRDFYNQANMLGIDSSVYEADYEDLLERAKKQKS